MSWGKDSLLDQGSDTQNRNKADAGEMALGLPFAIRGKGRNRPLRAGGGGGAADRIKTHWKGRNLSLVRGSELEKRPHTIHGPVISSSPRPSGGTHF